MNSDKTLYRPIVTHDGYAWIDLKDDEEIKKIFIKEPGKKKWVEFRRVETEKE